jgi:hypothetical protein
MNMDMDATPAEAGPGRDTLCIDTDDLRLAFFVDGQVERRPSYSATLYELGQPYLYVDGHCRYWSSSWNWDDSLQEWRPVHTGKLSAAEASMLMQQTWYGRLEMLAATCKGGSTQSDASRPIVSNGQYAARCAHGSAEFQKVTDDLSRTAAALYERGVEEKGFGVWVAVGPDSTPVTKVPPRAWPIDRDIADFIVPRDKTSDAGLAVHVTDEAQATTFRSMRDAFLQEQAALNPHESGVQIVGGYALYMRDAFPLNNAQGLVNYER